MNKMVFNSYNTTNVRQKLCSAEKKYYILLSITVT